MKNSRKPEQLIVSALLVIVEVMVLMQGVFQSENTMVPLRN